MTLGDRFFTVAAARAWNVLPNGVIAPSSPAFRRSLKIHLFHSVYNCPHLIIATCNFILYFYCHSVL